MIETDNMPIGKSIEDNIHLSLWYFAREEMCVCAICFFQAIDSAKMVEYENPGLNVKEFSPLSKTEPKILRYSLGGENKYSLVYTMISNP